MRAHSRYSVDPSRPRARATCDRCGFQYQHDKLQWQFQWMGPKLQNLRILVCCDCLDEPQPQLRTIILPPDPLPILNPRPEARVQDNNHISGIGQNAFPFLPAGTNIGTLIGYAGTYAAFDSNTNKPLRACATLAVSNSSFGNWVGKAWSNEPSGVGTPSGLTALSLSYTAASITFTAPNDSAFLGSSYATSYRFQGSSNASTWTTLGSGTTTGSHGESITNASLTGGDYAYHRLDLAGDGVRTIAVAQLAISVSNDGTLA